MPESPLMTTAETAEYARLSPETLRYFRQRSEGPRWVRLGRRVFYRRPDIDAWVEERVGVPRYAA